MKRLLIGATIATLAAHTAVTAPQDAILAAFDRYDVVAIADQRGVEQLGSLMAAVATADGFVSRGVEIVADFAGVAHQKTVDDYLNGETVAASAIRSAITASPAFSQGGAPRSYDAFLAAIRAANTGRPAPRRIKVWLPVSQVPTTTTTPLAARVLERLAAGRKVLLLADAFELVEGTLVVRMGADGPGGQRAAVGGAEFTQRAPTGGTPGGRVLMGRDVLPPGAQGLEPQASTIQVIRDTRPGKVLTLFPYCGLDDTAAAQKVEPAAASGGVGSITLLGSSATAHALRASTGADLAGGMLDGRLMAGMDGLLYLGPVSSLTVAPVRLSGTPMLVVDRAARRPPAERVMLPPRTMGQAGGN